MAVRVAGAQNGRPRWSREHMTARKTIEYLEEAARYLQLAHQTTLDGDLARRVERIRRDLRPCTSRAESLLKDIDLRQAEQESLL